MLSLKMISKRQITILFIQMFSLPSLIKKVAKQPQHDQSIDQVPKIPGRHQFLKTANHPKSQDHETNKQRQQLLLPHLRIPLHLVINRLAMLEVKDKVIQKVQRANLSVGLNDVKKQDDQ